ncbi:MAG: BamA/TamA family outer membrane protein [Cyclobacteriaceae bacterium]|nr:BamA/TamA family outer membrane protein [Cyclobacteriaceae bacterium]
MHGKSASNFLRVTAFVLLNLLTTSLAISQNPIAADTCIQKDLPDLIREARNKPPKEKDDGEGSLLLFPIIGSNPAIGFMVGVGGQYAFKMPGKSTLYSLVSGSAQYTTKNQVLFIMRNNIYSKNNKIFYTGDWRYQLFSQPTYGLGTRAPVGGILDYQYNLLGVEATIDSLAQPMNFNFARLNQSASLKLKENIYLGIGYNFDSYSSIVDQRLRLNPGDSLITSHYGYSRYYGFNPTRYYISALALNFVYDSRDNMINATKGYYLMVNWQGSRRILGSKNNADFFNMEYRSFHPVSKKDPRQILAFWMMGNFSPPGDLPFMILPATAYDQRSRSGRGYAQGRFRGNHLLYAETEYRFPISRCTDVLGGVLFVNATSASNPVLGEKLFDSVKPGYGMGLRVMIDKHSRTNLAIDFGFGHQSAGFYLAASETF